MSKAEGSADTSVVTARRQKRNRLWIIIGGIVVVAFAVTFASMTMVALHMRQANGSVFAKYVIDHHIGTAQIQDDASGFQGDFCVLQLNHPIPKGQLETESLALMREYNSLDGGTSLNIVYQDSAHNKQVTEASLLYDAAGHVVHMTLLEGRAHVQKDKPVQWTQQPVS